MPPAPAGVNTWTQLGPDGGELCALAVAPSDPTIVYAVGATYFRSADGGYTWESTGAPVDRTTCALSVDAADPLRLYALHPQGLLRSFDGGATWTASTTPFPPFYSPYRIAVDRHDANFLLVAAPGGIYRSRDRGDSWQLALHADHEYQSVAIDPAVAGRGFALSQFGGVQLSDDYGETWRDVNIGLPTDHLGLPQLAFDPGDARQIFLLQYGSLYRSRDRGLTWSFVRSADNPFSVEQIVTSGSALFARPGAGPAPPSQPRVLLRSLDAGESWQTLPDPFPHHAQTFFSDLVGMGEELLATSFYGFVRSIDQGETWLESNSGLRGTTIQGLSLDRQNPQRLFAVEPINGFRPPGFLRSLDGGAAWEHLPISYPEPGPTALRDLKVDPNDPTRYLGKLAGTYADGWGGITVSADAGRSWQTPYRGPFLGPASSELIVDPSDSNRIFSLAPFRFPNDNNPCLNLRSEDTGANWICIQPGPGTNALAVMAPNPVRAGVVVGQSYSTLFRSTDSGSHWTPVAGPPSFQPYVGGEIEWANAETAYATSYDDGLFVTRDGGLSWSPVSPDPENPEYPKIAEIATDPLHPETIFALPKTGPDESSRSVIRSADGGRSWQTVSSGLLGWPLSELTVDPVTPNRLYVSADGGGVLVYDVQIPGSCDPSSTAVCITDGRFKIESLWRDFAGRSGLGHAVQLASDTGSFWFFDRDNLELFVKEIDGVSFNNAFWTFYGALSNVEFTVLATDTTTGAQHGYFNPIRTFASRGDIESFPQEEGLAQPATAAAISGSWLRPRTAPMGSANACAPSATTLCLADGRFAASVIWHDFAGRSGAGTPIVLTPDTGSFWFFDAGIHELAVKVIDGRSLNHAFWVFYGSLSNVEFELTVVDTATGDTWTRSNPSGTFASNGDVEAFPQELP